jgi:ribonucleoside-diphosphate reductase alpha chain
MTGHAYATSARTAARMGPFAGYHENSEPMLNVLRMHRTRVRRASTRGRPTELLSAAQEAWDWPSSWPSSTACATRRPACWPPPGTIGLLMDCDTTGVEPDLGLVKTKKLVGGGTMSIVNQTCPGR